MWYIKSIKAINLFSWENLDIELEDKEIYAITGDNGSGKSSIFEIIKWVLFKKTNKKNVERYGTSGGEGTIILSNEDGDEMSINRKTSSPTGVLINDIENTQEILEHYIDCSYTSFMSAITCDQKRVSSFVNEKSPAGKSKIFGDMVGAGILDKMREKLQKPKQELEKTYESAKAVADSLATQLDEILSQFTPDTPAEFLSTLKNKAAKLKEYTQLMSLRQEEYKVGLDQVNSWKRWRESSKVIKELTTKIQEKKALAQALKASINPVKYKEKVEELEGILEAYRASELKTQENNSFIREVANEISSMVNAIKDGGKCPTCDTQLKDKNSIEEVKKKIQLKRTQLAQLDAEHIKYKNNLVTIKIAKEKIENWITIADREKSRLENLKEQLKSDVYSYKMIKVEKPDFIEPDLTQLADKVNGCSEAIHRMSLEINDGKNTLNNYKAISDKNKAATKTLKENEDKYLTYSWLWDHLPIMKLRFIDDNKIMVESIANEHLSKMGLPFTISIETQREMSKGNKIKDEFVFKIINVNSNQEAHKDDLSGGEEVCILLAMQFAINHVFNTNLGFEIYDEIYGPLDKKNKAVIIEAMKDRGKFKQILTVSHDDEISNSFNSAISIFKVDGISKIK
jgi:DNA repair exonuclease SbcCD ATPase subunit